MQEKQISGVPLGYEFTQKEFKILAQNLRLFAHAGIAGEIRANSQNTHFGRKVTLHSQTRHERGVRHGHSQTDTMGRLRHERDMIRALLSSEAPMEKARESSVVLGMFTTQTVFDQLARPLEERSPHLVESDELIGMRNQFIREHPYAAPTEQTE